MDPPEIGVHAPPLQETVANEEASRELNGTVIDGQEIKVDNADQASRELNGTVPSQDHPIKKPKPKILKING